MVGGEAEVAGGCEAGGLCLVGEDYSDFRVREAAGLDRLMDGEKVGAAPGEEDAKTAGELSGHTSLWHTRELHGNSAIVSGGNE